MYKWRLLLLASFAVFQPIASFTERSLIDGRQQCCDHQPHSLHRDTRLAIYGTYRFHKTAEDRRVNNRREILNTRRYEIRDFDSVLSRTTARQDSRERDWSSISLDRTSRFTRLENRRADIRDSRIRLSRDEHTYHKSVFRQPYDEITTDIHYGRLSKMSFDTERRNHVMRDNSGNFRQNNIRETRDLLHGTGNDVVRGEVANNNNNRHSTRNIDWDRRSFMYVSRSESRRQVINNHRLINQRARVISTSSRNDGSNRIVSKEFRESNLASSTLESRPQFGRHMQHRSSERESRQVYDYRTIQATESSRLYRDERSFTNQGNRRREPRTVTMERYMATRSQLNDELRTLDQHNRETIETRISPLLNTRSYDQNRNLNNIRRELHSMNAIQRTLQRTLIEIERREISRSVRQRDNVASENRNSVRRTREESQKDSRDERQSTIRSTRTAKNILDKERYYTSTSVGFDENSNRDKRFFDRKIGEINLQRRSIIREDIRLILQNEVREERRYVNRIHLDKRTKETLKDMTSAVRRDINERISMYQRAQKYADNSRVFGIQTPVENDIERKFAAKNQAERRAASESRITESRRMDSDIIRNRMSLDRRSQSSVDRSRAFTARAIWLNDVETRNRRVTTRNHDQNQEDTRFDNRLWESRNTRKDMTRDMVSLDKRSLRSADRLRVFNVRNQRYYGVSSKSDMRALSETRLIESRNRGDMTRERSSFNRLFKSRLMESKRTSRDIARGELSLDRRSQRSADLSRVLSFRDIRLENNVEIRTQKQYGVRSQDDWRALFQIRSFETKNHVDSTRERSSHKRITKSRFTESRKTGGNMIRDKLSFDRRSQKSVDRSRILSIRDSSLENNGEIRNQRQIGLRSQDNRRAFPEARLIESRNRGDMARERVSLDRKLQRSADRSNVNEIRLQNVAGTKDLRLQNTRSLEKRRALSESRLVHSRSDVARYYDNRTGHRYNDKLTQAIKEFATTRSIEYIQKQADVESTMINSRSRLNVGESARNRNSFTATIEESKLNSFIFNWQYLFYILQGIYIFGVILQIRENESENKKVRSFHFWGASSWNAVKID